MTVEGAWQKRLPETDGHCVDDEAPSDHEPCPKTPIWKIFLIFDRGHSDHLGDGLSTLVFLARFFLNREHSGKRGGGEERVENQSQGLGHEIVDGTILAREMYISHGGG